VEQAIEQPRRHSLRWNEWLMAVSAVVLALVTFLDWFSGGEVGEFTDDEGVLGFTVNDGGRTAWQAFTSVDCVLAAVVLAAAYVVLVMRGGQDEPALLLARIEAVLALVAGACVAVRIASPPAAGLGPNVEVEPTAWAWVGLVASCLIVVASVLAGGRAQRLSRRER
jgi:drug/metabolite transporter (DMT)-like permease